MTTDNKKQLSYFQKLCNDVTKKPFKKFYRVILLGLILFVATNNSNNTKLFDNMLEGLKDDIISHFSNTTLMS